MVEALPRVANSPQTGLVWYVPDRTKLIYAFKRQNQMSQLVCNFKSWHSRCVRFAYIGPKIWLGVAHLVASSLLTWALSQRNYIIFMKTRHTSTHKIYLVLIQSKVLEKWLKEFGISLYTRNWPDPGLMYTEYLHCMLLQGTDTYTYMHYYLRISNFTGLCEDCRHGVRAQETTHGEGRVI